MMRLVLALALMIAAPASQAQAPEAAPVLTEREIAELFTPDALNLRVLRIEAALARAQAGEGVIPQSAADAITEAAVMENLPAEALAEENAIVRHRMVALLNVLRRSLDEESASYLHYGATTVDVYDTARMLQLRAAVLYLIEDLRALELQLIELAQAHRATPMIGRTLGQHALPITFGKKMSVWIGENRRHIDRLSDLLDRVERSSIMKGAVGSYLGLGPEAMAVERGFAAELGLAAPYEDDWHASRDVMAEFAQLCGLIARSWARFGQEIFLLQSTDIGELVEVRPATTVGSSAMPHKSNPSLSEALIQHGRIIPRQAEIVADDMINFFERDNTSRPNRALEAVAVEMEGQLINASRLINRLEVFPGAMRANLDTSQGWILSQRVVFALSEHMAREEAEQRLRALADAARLSGASLAEALASDEEIAALLSEDERAELLDPATYLGLAAEQTDAVIAAAQAARTNDPQP
ncbi:MAG: lyase family protein [Pseudomonadota bacterium]